MWNKLDESDEDVAGVLDETEEADTEILVLGVSEAVDPFVDPVVFRPDWDSWDAPRECAASERADKSRRPVELESFVVPLTGAPMFAGFD